MRKKKLLYFVTEDWYFFSHRLPLAIEAKKRGYDIVLITRVKNHGKLIEDNGIRIINLDMERHGKNPFREILTLYRIFNIYKAEQPDILHHIALKPVLYGTLCGILTNIDLLVNTFPGMGYLFESDKTVHRIYKNIILMILRILFINKSVSVIVQNKETYEIFQNKHILDKSRLYLIRGSGIDLRVFDKPVIKENDVPKILLASRLLWQKGVGDYVEAARIIKSNNIDINFLLAGKPDEGNPNSVDESILKEWHESGLVEWLGYRDDMPEIIAKCDLVCLPTYYGEGLPKILLEAAACGKPIITTDIPGCREIVKNNVNGYLVPVHNPEILADSITKLLNDKILCKKMGAEGRRMVKENFLLEKINSETINVYERLADKAC